MKINVGQYYRHKNTPNYGWAKVISILPPHTGVNTHGYRIAECEWSVEEKATFGLIKYFRLTDLEVEK